jgi:hypothetical protein
MVRGSTRPVAIVHDFSQHIAPNAVQVPAKVYDEIRDLQVAAIKDMRMYINKKRRAPGVVPGVEHKSVGRYRINPQPPRAAAGKVNS